MLLTIPAVLTPEQVRTCRDKLDNADWIDGKTTAGYLSAHSKDNAQLAEENPVAQEIGSVILQALSRNALFMSAALPLKVFPPLFNCYRGGQSFGSHVDNAIRDHRASGQRVRTDLSCTLFLAEPDEYDGGELWIEDTYGAHKVKLPAGHMILYPSTSLHRVTPVTRGARIASFFWLQSLVRDDADRTLLFELDATIQQLQQQQPHSEHVLRLMGVYHNLLRKWSDT